MSLTVPALDVFEATPNPYLLLAADSPIFTIIGVNEAYLRATMMQRDTLVGRPLFEVFPDDPTTPEAFGVRNLRASLEHALKSGQPDRMPVQHYNVRRPDGVFEERHWRPLSVPVIGPGGEVLSLIHYVEDVTADVVGARDARSALAASDARYRAIVESSTDYAIVATDLSGVITTWNTGAERVFGWTAKEMVGRSSQTFFTEEDCANNIPAQEMREALTQGRGADERWHLRKGGVRFWGSGEVMPLKDGAEVIGFIKILRDRTSQRETEQALAQQTSILRTITDHVSEAVFRLAPDGTILLANPAAERLFGWLVEDLKGRNLHETLHHHREDGSAFAAADCIFVHALRTGTSLVGEEAVFLRRDNTPVPVECTSVPLHTDGTVSGAVITVTDITARKQAQEQQDILNRELSHRLKNTLALVQSIASQTLRNAHDLDAAREALATRLIALGKAHDVLLTGTADTASVVLIVEGALRLHDDTGHRFRVSGPALHVGPSAALALALMLHELATNAIKYGALSVPDGIVTIAWVIDDIGDGPEFRLEWQEQKGPPVTPPSRKGFGSRLIQRGLAGGEVVLCYPAEGVHCTLTAPLADLLAN